MKEDFYISESNTKYTCNSPVDNHGQSNKKLFTSNTHEESRKHPIENISLTSLS